MPILPHATIDPMTLPEALAWATERRVALPHFNVSDSHQLAAIARLSQELAVPLIIGVSQGEEEYLGRGQIAALVGAYRKEGASLFLNADHCHTRERASAAIDAGYDAVIIDGSALSFEENVSQARDVVAHAKSSGRNVLVEGELGYIGTSSALLESIPEGAGVERTTVDDAVRFVRETGVHLFSPSVGNIHGMLKNAHNPELDIDRIEALSGALDVPLVLHGGSGIRDEDFKSAIRAGIRVVHINTELRVAYRDGITRALAECPNEIAPYKYLSAAALYMAEIARARVQLFTQE